MKNLFIKRTLSPFMSTFEFVNKIGFNFLRNEIVESNVFNLYNGYIYVYFFCVCERKLCQLFKWKSKNFEIQLKVNSKEVLIYVCHLGDLASKQGEVILNELLNFKLPLLGWKDSCKALNYKSYIDNRFILEYTFKMKKNWFFKSSWLWL